MTVYHNINSYDYHTVYICLSTVFGENKRFSISPQARQQLSTKLFSCSTTRAAETTSDTEAVISHLYPSSKYKSKLVVWEYFGYRKDERLFVLDDRHSSQKLVANQPQKEETHRTCLPIFQNSIPLCTYSFIPFIT